MVVHAVEAGILGLLADHSRGIGVDGDDAAIHEVVILHAAHALSHGLEGEVGGPCAEVGVVHAAGGVGAVADEGVRAGVVRDAVDGKVLSDGHFRRHDHVVGRGEHGIHTGGDERGGGGDDLVVGVGGLLDVLDALCVKVCLCVRDGLGGVRLIEGVEQADLGDIGVLGEHHVHNKIGVERVARAGHIVDAGELRGLRVGNCGIDHRSLRVLGGERGDLRGGGGDGNDGVHAVGDGLIGKLLENGLVALAGGDLVLDLHALRLRKLIQLGGDGVCDLVERGVVELLDDRNTEAAGRTAVRPAVRLGILCAAGGEGQRHRAGKNEGQNLFHHVVFHFGFPPIYLILGGR